jgi:predicted Zn finger-like uncharacterized protein
MSSSITQCPGCFTRFLVTAEQLAAHDGVVRCGRCDGVFNATEHLEKAESTTPQIKTPAPRPENVAPPVAKPQIEAMSDDEEPGHFVSLSINTAGLETLSHQIISTDEIDSDKAPPAAPARKPAPKPKAPTPRKPRNWPWVVSSLLLVLLIVAQGFYFLRIDIAAQLPGLKPALISYCELLGCTIPLPEKADLLSIESSDLAAVPMQPSVVTLSALLHNHATYTQAYPSLELSLTDTQDKVLVRRVFTPVEYLPTGDDSKLGLGSNREINIQLHLDSGELRPVGYKLLLFFPHNI